MVDRWKVFAARCGCGCGWRYWYAHGPDLSGLTMWLSLSAAHDYAGLAAMYGPTEAIRILQTREALRLFGGGGRARP